MSISSKSFCSPKDIEKENSEITTNEKDEMQKYEKRILQCALAEKIIPVDLKYWPFFHVLKPEFIRQIYMIMIYSLNLYDCYSGHDKKVIIMTKDKNVYNLDLDCNKDEHLKTDNIYTAALHNGVYLKEIKELRGKNIKTFAHNYYFIMALTEEGEVYYWTYKIWSSILSPILSPIQLLSLNNKCIVDIACGRHNFLALISNGEVYTWEDSIGSKENNFNSIVPRQVKHELEKKNVIHIACGTDFNIVVTDENKLYGWGENMRGQITTETQKHYMYPREITTLSDKIVKIACGYEHTLVLTNKGEIYAWGNNVNGQVGTYNNWKPCGPILVNVPQMGKVLDIAAHVNLSVAVGYDRTIYVWGCFYYSCNFTIPTPTKFSRMFDAFAHSMWRIMYKPLIIHDPQHIARSTNNNKYIEEELNILESLETAFDDPSTSDCIIQVEGRPIYVHKAILNIRCKYFGNMSHHHWTESVQSISDLSSVCTISDKFSYIVYKAFLKYLYTGTIDLPIMQRTHRVHPLKNALEAERHFVTELMELAEMYGEINLQKDCSQIKNQINQTIMMPALYNRAIEYNAKEFENFYSQTFALRHVTADTLSEDYIKLDMSMQTNFKHRAVIKNYASIMSSTKFYSQNKNVEKRYSKTTKNEMQIYEKRILQYVLAEKIISIDLKIWPFFQLLKTEFIPQIYMVMIYRRVSSLYTGQDEQAIIVTKDKNVYSLDYNKYEHLKTRDIHTAHFLKEIKELCGKNIKTFTRSNNFFMALTEEGQVYFCKNVEDNNVEYSYVPTFTLVAGLSDKRIIDIGCGNVYLLALSIDGKVYTWECNFDNQVVNENRAIFNNEPKQVKDKLEKRNVIYIACSAIFNIVVTDENKIYGWGDNQNGQITIVGTQKYYEYPCEVTTISDKIVKIACGYEHTLVLTDKGEIYAWGNNSCGEVGVNNNWKPSHPTVVNVPEMGKVLDIAAYARLSVAVGCDRTIYMWGLFYSDFRITIPFPTKFSRIHDVFAYSFWNTMHEPLIMFANNFNYVEERLNILESLRALFDDPLRNDFTIRVEGRSIYVHKAILKIRCQYFRKMFQHEWSENIRSISDSVYTVSDKFSYVVYKAFLKYLYIGIIDLPLEYALELMELANMYGEVNLIKDCSQIIKKVITVSNVAFFYNKAITYNAKDLEEFCFQFALRHMITVV